jgi:uncharacterized protein (DUF2345 family)
MKRQTLVYAEKQISITAKENGIRVFISDDKLYIEVANGKNYQLSNEEIEYQATEYLKGEIENVKHNI